ncbi:MAG: phytoene/squalene synthase family protein [Planctomycetes bacterium]|nr:phytoene/squalene synthase family protein [Planctomycetota bacterium]
MSRTLLEDSFDHCIRLTKRTAGNFYYSFCGLPAPQFQAMCALYAFMRVTDDWGDDTTRAPAQRLADLDDWQHALTASLRPDWSIAEMTSWSDSARMVLPAMSNVAERFVIPLEHLFAVVRGVRSDLESFGDSSPIRFQTFAELADYCYLVAGAVGLCCIHIWGFHGSEAAQRAIDCGTALQLTNILRDVGEDAAAGRVYLPAEDLQRFGVTAEDLIAQRCDDRFCALMAFEAERAKSFYALAEQLVPCLQPHGRPIMKAMLQLYGGLLHEIERRQFDVFRQHVSLPRWRKLWIAADALIHQKLLPK